MSFIILVNNGLAAISTTQPFCRLISHDGLMVRRVHVRCHILDKVAHAPPPYRGRCAGTHKKFHLAETIGNMLLISLLGKMADPIGN
jgi:hypothetical protein